MIDWSAWGVAWGDSWGDSWGPLHAVEEYPALYASGSNAPPLAQYEKRRGGIRRRITAREEARRVKRRHADEEFFLAL